MWEKAGNRDGDFATDADVFQACDNIENITFQNSTLYHHEILVIQLPNFFQPLTIDRRTNEIILRGNHT